MSAAAVRWIVPAAVTALVVGGGVAASATGGSVPDLPERSAEDLLVAVGQAEPTPFSGTVRTVADLGLPSLGALASPQGGAATPTDPTSALTRLLSGENSLRVWVGGPEQQRVSLLDDFSELDVRRDGDELWTYSSSDDTATRYDLAEIGDRLEAAAEEHAAEHPEALPDATPDPTEQAAPWAGMTPDELARTLVEQADPTTEIAVGENQVVAGRDAYTLTMTPRDEATLVGGIELAVDAETGLVLQVQVDARDQEAPAFVTGFTALDLGAPDPSVFAYTPAEGTTVVDALDEAEKAKAEAEADGTDPRPAPGENRPSDAVEAPEPVVHGEGWSTVLELALPADAQGLPGDATEPGTEPSTGVEPDPEEPVVDPEALLGQLTTEVDGGRVFSSALVTVLLTDDGRVLLGAVDADTLLQYAG